MFSEQDSIDPTQLVGQSVNWRAYPAEKRLT
jgi:hypothetical protein